MVVQRIFNHGNPGISKVMLGTTNLGRSSVMRAKPAKYRVTYSQVIHGFLTKHLPRISLLFLARVSSVIAKFKINAAMCGSGK